MNVKELAERLAAIAEEHPEAEVWLYGADEDCGRSSVGALLERIELGQDHHGKFEVNLSTTGDDDVDEDDWYTPEEAYRHGKRVAANIVRGYPLVDDMEFSLEELLEDACKLARETYRHPGNEYWTQEQYEAYCRGVHSAK